MTYELIHSIYDLADADMARYLEDAYLELVAEGSVALRDLPLEEHPAYLDIAARANDDLRDYFERKRSE